MDPVDFGTVGRYVFWWYAREYGRPWLLTITHVICTEDTRVLARKSAIYCAVSESKMAPLQPILAPHANSPQLMHMYSYRHRCDQCVFDPNNGWHSELHLNFKRISRCITVASVFGTLVSRRIGLSRYLRCYQQIPS